jgi:putative hydrolase of the HAD superfamily
MYKLLLIDLDGVIRLWPDHIDRQIEAVAGLPAGAIKSAAFSVDILEAAITGRILEAAITGRCTDDEWRRAIAQKLAAKTGPAIATETVRRWSMSSGTVNAPCLQLLEELSESVRIALVTNATSRLNDDLRTLGIQERFASVFNSYHMGVAKPERTFFEQVLNATGTDPSATLYIDDSGSNVNAARELGIQSHLFEDTENLRRFLEAADVLQRAELYNQ